MRGLAVQQPHAGSLGGIAAEEALFAQDKEIASLNGGVPKRRDTIRIRLPLPKPLTQELLQLGFEPQPRQIETVRDELLKTVGVPLEADLTAPVVS